MVRLILAKYIYIYSEISLMLGVIYGFIYIFDDGFKKFIGEKYSLLIIHLQQIPLISHWKGLF